MAMAMQLKQLPRCSSNVDRPRYIVDRPGYTVVAASSSCASSSSRTSVKPGPAAATTAATAATAAAAAAAVVVSLDCGAAQAVTAEEIAGTLNKVGDYAGQATSTVSATYDFVSEAFREVLTFVKPALDVALPFVQQTTDTALKAAAPVASDAASQVLKSLGLDEKPVLDAGKTAVSVAGKAAEQTGTLIEGVKPVVTSSLESLLKSDPLTIAGEVGIVAVLYFLAPAIFSSIAEAARGYKGELTAAQALDLVSSGKYTLIDVRSEKEKAKSGIPSVPNSAKKNVVFLAIEELPGKLRSQLRDARATEAEVAAVKISALKKINKGSNIVILDSTGGVAKQVAKALCALGFKKTWTVLDGFDGGRGWVKNRLGTEGYNLSFAEILNPSKVIAPRTIIKTLTSKSSDVVDVPSRSNKLLPSGYDD